MLVIFQALCIAVAITINYFYLVAFGWMVMEGVMLYLKVVKVFNVATSTKYFYGFAWGNKIKTGTTVYKICYCMCSLCINSGVRIVCSYNQCIT